MSHIKTSLLFIVLTLTASASFADPVRDCFNQGLIDAKIAGMQNIYNPNTYAGGLAIKIWTACGGASVKKTSTGNTTNIEELKEESICHVGQDCQPVNSHETSTSVEI